MGSIIAKFFVDVAILPLNGEDLTSLCSAFNASMHNATTMAGAAATYDEYCDAESLETSWGFIELVTQMVFYVIVLYKGSQMIGEGAELLLLVPGWEGLVGSVVLPILGAVPDGAIVLFSGLGDIAEVKQEIAVGVGALAGSTIMLLTVPWSLSVIGGRVDLRSDGTANYKGKPKLTRVSGMAALTKTGVTVADDVRFGAVIMMATTASYVILQAAAFGSGSHGMKDDTGVDEAAEVAAQKWWALTATIISAVLFVAYCWYCAARANEEDSAEHKVVETKVERVQSTVVMKGDADIFSLLVAQEEGILARRRASSGYAAMGDEGDRSQSPTRRRIKRAFNRAWKRHDVRRNNVLTLHDVSHMLTDMGLAKTHSNMIQADLVRRRVVTGPKLQVRRSSMRLSMDNVLFETSEEENGDSADLEPSLNAEDVEGKGELQEEEPEDDDVDSDEEEEEAPPQKYMLDGGKLNTRAIKWDACKQMAIGTVLVLIFSDPMCDALNDLGTRMGFKTPFYISFVLAPLASNASEFMAAFSFSKKKTRASIGVSFSTLVGAAIMNNTFCLFIFAALMFLRGLPWEYAAETISIVFVELAIFFMVIPRCGCNKGPRTMQLWQGLAIFALFPVSILLVWFLENVVGLD